MDFEKIKAASQAYQADMTRFLRDMISHPSESCEEREVVHCIKAEMEKLGYDKVEIDGLGNVIGWMGDGDKIIAIDSHIDTVGVGNIDNWTHDPYQGYEDDQVIYGRGGSDQEGGMASATYGAKIMKDLGLIPAGYKIMVVGSVQEEDCDGMCWQYIVNKYFPANGIKKEQVEFVISTEPTDGGIYRGHRGRMEIRVDVKGVSCHGSAPERGDISRRVDALKACREHDAPLRQLLPDALRAHASHVRAAVRTVRPDRHLPAGERDCRHTERGKRDRAEGHARGLPRGEQSVQLTQRRFLRQLAGAREQRIGRVALRAEHDHHVVPLLPGAPHDPHGTQQPLAVTHTAAAEFLYDKAHSSPLLFPAKK